MSEKLDLNFVKKLQRTVEPSIRPGETALEAIKRMEAERVSSMIQNQAPADAGLPPTKPHNMMSSDLPKSAPKEAPPQEVVFYEGYKLPRDFFTCVGMCLLKSKDPAVKRLLEIFGFTMKDLNGKDIIFTRPRIKRRRTSKK